MLKHCIIHDKPCSDHEGTLYPNIKSMCAHWNISPETYSRRISVYNMSQEEALTRPIKPNGGIICYDHLGEKYYSMTSMCEQWEIPRKLYKYRITHGWTQERALTTPPRSTKNK